MMTATQPRRRRRKTIITPEFPSDVIFNNILPRLPARYVMKYLCVSKEWYSFLKSPMFVNMHLDHVTSDDHENHHKLLLLHENETTQTLSYSNIDCETHEPSMRRHRPLLFAHSSQDIRIKSSCNGLVLVALLRRKINRTMLSDLIIWNPLTNEYKHLSKTDLNISYLRTVFELYYISSEQDYRVLLITMDNDVYIYSLKSDSWRKMNFECVPYNSISLSCLPSTCWSEKLYFKRDHFCNFITMLDTKTEKFTSISTPRLEFNWNSSAIVQRGCVYMCQNNHSYDPCIKLWSMDRTTGVWEKISTYTRMQDIAHSFVEPMHLMRDGNWLMKHDAMCKNYYKVDLENKHDEGGLYSYEPEGFVAGVYIETFVSPNQYMN